MAAFLYDCVSHNAILTMLSLSGIAAGAVYAARNWGVRPTLSIRLPRRRPVPSPPRPVDRHVPIRHVAPGTWGRKPHGW